MATTRKDWAPNVLKGIVKEMRTLQQSPPEDIQVVVNDEDLSEIQAWIRGPAGTPYENGCFKVRLALGEEFPAAPPKGYFVTKIFHPNVSPAGEICVNTLKKDWKSELGIAHVLLTVKCLLIVPNPESALNEEAGKLLLEQYDDYARRARLYTSIHAKSGVTEFERLASERSTKEPEPTKDTATSTKATTVTSTVTTTTATTTTATTTTATTTTTTSSTSNSTADTFALPKSNGSDAKQTNAPSVLTPSAVNNGVTPNPATGKLKRTNDKASLDDKNNNTTSVKRGKITAPKDKKKGLRRL